MPPRTRRRLGRGLAWAVAAVSLLLAGVWVGSMRWEAGYALSPSRDIEVSAGGVVYNINVQILELRLPPDAHRSGPWFFATHGWWARWWFSYVDTRTGPFGWLRCFIPLWPFVLLTGVPSAGYLYATRRRNGPGVCRACGYDLTGLRPNTPCPECGPADGIHANSGLANSVHADSTHAAADLGRVTTTPE